MMRRREFIMALGGAAAAWPLAARAQQPVMPVIGYLSSGSPVSDTFRVTGLQRGLNEAGYVEGRNVAIEYRWAGNQADRLPALAADLVQLRVAVIVSPGLLPTLAARPAEAPQSPPIDAAEAVRAGWLELWYQPIISTRTLMVQEAEGLIRLRHPTWGIVPPAYFIPDDGDPHFRELS